jgi:hypothetical protein
MEELLVAQSGSLSRCHPLNKTDIVLHCDFSADRKHRSDSAVRISDVCAYLKKARLYSLGISEPSGSRS